MWLGCETNRTRKREEKKGVCEYEGQTGQGGRPEQAVWVVCLFPPVESVGPERRAQRRRKRSERSWHI